MRQAFRQSEFVHVLTLHLCDAWCGPLSIDSSAAISRVRPSFQRTLPRTSNILLEETIIFFEVSIRVSFLGSWMGFRRIPKGAPRASEESSPGGGPSEPAAGSARLDTQRTSPCVQRLALLRVQELGSKGTYKQAITTSHSC